MKVPPRLVGLVLVASGLSFFDSVVLAQSADTLNANAPVAAASTLPPGTTVSIAGGYVITYTPGQPITVAAEDGSGTASFTVSKALRFLDSHGADISASSIKPGARMQVLLDDTTVGKPMISRIMVDTAN